MSISLVAALVGTLAAAVGTVVLAVRCARTPRADLIAWAIATAGLTVALAAQALGYRRGFAPTTFRAVQLGAQLVAPLALVWGVVEVAARSLPARFAARLVISALAVVAVVILGTDPLSSQAFGQSWPAASVYYQVIPNALLKLIAVVTVFTAVVGAAVAGVRARGDRAWRDGFVAVGVAGVAAIATEGLSVQLPANSGYPALCLVAAGLAVLASMLAGRFQLAALHAPRSSADDTGWGPAMQAGARAAGGTARTIHSACTGIAATAGTRSRPAVTDDTATPAMAARTMPTTGPPPALSRDRSPVVSTGRTRVVSSGRTRVVSTGQSPAPSIPSISRTAIPVPVTKRTTSGTPMPVTWPRSAADRRDAEPAGAWRQGGYSGDENIGPGAALLAAGDSGAAGPAGEQDTERLYGQIAIYTLLEHGAAEFDRLAEQVVEQVRVHEDGTLVYVLHGVPSAPLQRILYEVYRDRAAYDEHTRQPYIQKFEIGRRPLVLATNLIELGVRHAKVSPLEPPPGPSPGSPATGARPPLARPPLARPPLGSPPSGLPYGGARGDRAPGGEARDERPGGRAP